jgi:putative hydrolase of the HAD superfamily
MIKAIVFDWGQTLVDSADGFRVAEKQAQDRLFADLSISDHDAFMQHYRRIRRECHEKSRLSRIVIWRELYWYYCREADLEKLQAWEQDYWHTVEHHTQVFPEALRVLQGLARQYRLALITNTQGQTDQQAHRLRAYPELTTCFEVVIVAGENDVPPKPDAQAFGRCLDKLQLTPQEAVYVGDDWRNDVLGAQNAGMHPVWLRHHSVQRNYPDVSCALPVISSLDELPTLLASDAFTGQAE